jgi:hypothetical protein
MWHYNERLCKGPLLLFSNSHYDLGQPPPGVVHNETSCILFWLKARP